MYGEPGEFYFHYTTRAAAFEHILPTRELRLSPYTKMRDPLEAHPWTFTASTHLAEHLDIGSREVKEHEAIDQHEDLTKRANRIKRGMKLLSLTVDADGYLEALQPFARGYSRSRMWEHYAERHAGVCLVFNRESLNAAVLGALNQLGPFWRGRVEYTPGGLVGSRARKLDMDALLGPNSSKSLAQHIEEHHEALFFTKLADWETEHEYRYMVLTSGSDYVYAPFLDSLEAVFVGERFPSWQLSGAKAACDAVGADLLIMNWSSGWPLPLPPDRSVFDGP